MLTTALSLLWLPRILALKIGAFTVHNFDARWASQLLPLAGLDEAPIALRYHRIMKLDSVEVV
jgi:hypothetical protein